MACEHDFEECRCIDSADVVGIMELAEFFSVGRSTISNWAAHRAQNGMPEPLFVLGCGPGYSMEAVKRWWIDWKPTNARKSGELPREK